MNVLQTLWGAYSHKIIRRSKRVFHIHQGNTLLLRHEIWNDMSIDKIQKLGVKPFDWGIKDFYNLEKDLKFTKYSQFLNFFYTKNRFL